MRSHDGNLMLERVGAVARIVAVVTLALVLQAVVPEAAAAQDCWVGLKMQSPSSTPVTIDGVKDPGEWDDASLIKSGDDCLDVLWDWSQTGLSGSHAVPDIQRAVQVYSKRDATNLYLLFLVEDNTSQQTNGGALARGEKIIIEIDPDSSRLGQLSIGPGASQVDYRLDFTHKWSTATVVKEFYKSAPSTTCTVSGVTHQTWNAGSTGFATDQWNSTPGLDAALNTTTVAPRTYGVEFKIPLAAVGLATPFAHQGLGIAFAVINDLGNSTPGGTTDATAATFPNTLKLVNASGLVTNPLDPLDCGAWLAEANWGGGYFQTQPTDVTISRLPQVWLSDAIRAYDCTIADTSTGTENYLWYEAKPCKVTVRATIRNWSTANKTRHLVFLMGHWDAAGGSHWTTLAVQRVSVPGVILPPPPRESTYPVIQWNVPMALWNMPNHPCLRVYILPQDLRADLDSVTIAGWLDASGATLADFESKYGIADDHWAQKNLTVATTGNTCPGPNCPSTALLAPAGPSRVLAIEPGPRGWLRFFAPEPLLAEPLTAARDTGVKILWSREDQRRFGEGNVVVQVASFGYANSSSGQTLAYNFIEPLGGVVKVFPAAMVTKDVTLQLEFDVTNRTDVERTIFLKVDQQVPTGLHGVRVVVDTGPLTYGPGQTRTIKGVVTTASPGLPWWLWLLIIVLIVLLIAFAIWRTRKAS